MFGYIDQVEIDFVVNGRAEGGGFADRMNMTGHDGVRFDAGLLRPMIGDDGKKYCWVANGKPKRNSAGQIEYGTSGDPLPDRDPIPLARLIANGMVPPIFNASALPYLVWQKIDQAVVRAARAPMSAWADLAAANTYSGFNGMAVTGIVKDTMTEDGDAKVDMDKLSDDLSTAPLYTPDILPLPIIHSGFEVGPRTLAMSRNSGMPIDTTQAEVCGRRCAETLEKMTIGVTDMSAFTIGASATFTNRGIYGFRTHPDRITKTNLTSPSPWTDGTSAQTLVNEVIAMVELARAQNFFGPFVLYYSSNFDQYMARDYYTLTTSGAAAPTMTVLDRLKRIHRIQDVKPLWFYSNTSELILVNMTAETVRAVDGMDWTPIQYEKPGGTGLVYRCMGIKVPDIRSQYVSTPASDGVTTRKAGIVHATTS